MAKYQELADAIIKGDNFGSKDIAEKLVANGVAAEEILNEGLVPGMNVVGTKFKASEIYVPEVLIAKRAIVAAMDILKPLLSEADVETKGNIVADNLEEVNKFLDPGWLRCSCSDRPVSEEPIGT